VKFLHISDLHIGKRLHEQPLIDEQRYILAELLRIARERMVDAVLIAGDVYDRSVPPVDAVDVFDDFITELSEAGIAVFVIAGNHDSAERLDFGSRIMSRRGVHFAGSGMKTVAMTDELGAVNIWLMPFMRSANAVAALEAADVDVTARNIIIAHQFVTSAGGDPELGGSESVAIGGTDAIDASLFDKFDYAALGHIHRPQSVGRTTARYCGSPYRYSFDECSHTKSVIVGEIREKADITLDFVPLVPQRDLYRLKCKLAELAAQTAPRDSYVEVTLTDDEPIVDAITKVREVYLNTLRLIIDNKYSHGGAIHALTGSDIKAKTPLELFSGFFEEMNGEPPSAEQRAIIKNAIEGVENETD
jgi:exonuclease SbcD